MGVNCPDITIIVPLSDFDFRSQTSISSQRNLPSRVVCLPIVGLWITQHTILSAIRECLHSKDFWQKDAYEMSLYFKNQKVLNNRKHWKFGTYYFPAPVLGNVYLYNPCVISLKASFVAQDNFLPVREYYACMPRTKSVFVVMGVQCSISGTLVNDFCRCVKVIFPDFWPGL